MVTFVQATYALVTFVQISNISAVTGPILTKLFGPNLCVVIIFVDQNVLVQNFFQTQNFILMDQKKNSKSKFFKPKIVFQSQNFFGPKICLKVFFSDQTLFLEQQFFSKIISGPIINFAPQFFFRKFLQNSKKISSPNFFMAQNFQTRNFIGSKNIFNPKLLRTQFFSDQNSFSRTKFFFGPKLFSRPNFFLKFFFGPNIFLDKNFVKPFQAEHFRLESCFKIKFVFSTCQKY